MKISKETLAVLKNYSVINPNLLIKPGSKIETVSETKTIISSATVQEQFPVKFAIWDLNKFLATVSLFNDPDIVFSDKYLTISDGNKSVKYWYANESLITTIPPDKKIIMPPAVVEFDLTNDTLQEIIKASSIMGLPDLSVESDGTHINLVVYDAKDKSTTNRYSVCVATDSVPEGVEFSFCYKIGNIKLLKNDYHVMIAENTISQFTATDLVYWVAIEATSKYTKK